MNLLKVNKIIIIVFVLAISTKFSFAQQGYVDINQDENLVILLNLKKEMNLDDDNSNRYKIQIYSGDREGAKKARTKFKSKINGIPSVLVYETPNYKIWVGNFRSRLEADRALIKVKKTFKDAFRFKPKKEKSTKKATH